LSGRRLLLGVRVVRILLVRFVMAHDAAGCGAQLAVSRHMAGGAADDGAFDAALGVHNGAARAAADEACTVKPATPSFVASFY
jgi:hypothetical protein